MPDESLIEKLRIVLNSPRGAECRVTMPEPEAAKKPKRAPTAEAFIHVTVREFLSGVSVLDGALELSVWIYLLRVRRMYHLTRPGEPIALSNSNLATWGVSRVI